MLTKRYILLLPFLFLLLVASSVNAFSITVSNPGNATYNTTVIPLNFSVDKGNDTISNCWYSVSSGANTTISSCNNLSDISDSIGSNFLSVFVNNTGVTKYTTNGSAAYNVAGDDGDFTSPTLSTDNNLVTAAFRDITTATPAVYRFIVNFSYNPAWNSTDTQNITVTSFVGLNNSVVGSYSFSIQVWNYTGSTYQTILSSSSDFGVWKNVSIDKRTHINNSNVSVRYVFSTANEPKSIYINESQIIITGNSTLTTASAAVNYTIAFNFQPCLPGQTPNLNLSFFDENSVTTPINSSLSADFYLFSGSANVTKGYSLSGNSSYVFCLTPNSTSASLNATIIYSANSFYQRTYYLVNANITNATQTVSLYLLNVTNDGLVRIFLESAVGVADPNKYIRAERYYPETAQSGAYKTVAMIKTAEITGDGFTFLEYAPAYYRFIVLQDNTILKIFSNQQIEKESVADEYASVVLRLSEVEDEHLKYLAGTLVAYSCAADNITAIVSCTIEDTSGLFVSSNLTVYKFYKNITLPVCSQTTTASGATLLCNISTSGNGTFIYRARVTASSGTTYIITSDIFTIGLALNMEGVGMDILIFFFLIMSMIGLYNWRIGMVLGCVAVGSSIFIMGAWDVLAGALISMILIAGIHIFRGR